jgi:hypothetical protein
MAAVVFIEIDHPLGVMRMINVAPRRGESTDETVLEACRIEGKRRNNSAKSRSADARRLQDTRRGNKLVFGLGSGSNSHLTGDGEVGTPSYKSARPFQAAVTRAALLSALRLPRNNLARVRA